MSELTPASEQLIRDWDRHPDAIDASELSARLWLVERQAAERARQPASPDLRAAVMALPVHWWHNPLTDQDEPRVNRDDVLAALGEPR